jgi:hypothetical protein
MLKERDIEVQYNKDVTTFRVKMNYNFPKKEREKKNLGLQTMFINKILMETRFIIFPIEKMGQVLFLYTM